uniref:Phosphatidate cytidylyltransferase n=1 Tax=Pseudo-nitzschia australis TaxID=44445 RepID=A0A7S4AI34_9STRA
MIKIALPTIPSLLLVALVLLSTGGTDHPSLLLVHGRSTTPWSPGKRTGGFPATIVTFPPPAVLQTVQILRGGSSSGGSGFGTSRSNINIDALSATRISGGATSSTSTSSSNSNSSNDKPPPDATIIEGSETTTILRAGATNLDSTSTSTPTASDDDDTVGGTIVDNTSDRSNSNENDGKLLSSKEKKKVQKFKSKEEKKVKRKEKKFHAHIAKQLKNRNAANKRRKFMHAAWGMLFASLHHFIPRNRFLPGMTTLTTLTLIMELLRYRKGFDWMNKSLHFVLGKALRKNEMEGKFTGSLYYFSGVTLTSYLFPKSCATLGIVQLAIADPSASYFGRATRHVYWSRINNGFFGLGRNKGILGCLGGAVSCVPLNYRLLSLALVKNTGTAAARTIAKPTVLAISLALGMAGALADLMVPTPSLTLPKRVCGVRVPPFHLDDNIVVPVLSGWACVYILAAASIGRNELVLAKYLVV